MINILGVRPPSFRMDIHDLPKSASLPLVLRASVARPPVLVRVFSAFAPVLHVGPQDGGHAAFAPRRAVWPEVRAVEAEGDVDAAVRGLYGLARAAREGRTEEVERRLRGYGMLEALLRRSVHYYKLR